jgi:dihydroneopterin aldolase
MHAFHGLHPEEKIIGNDFELDLDVQYIPDLGIISGIADTVNYVRLFEIVHEQMMIPRDLLETFAMELADLVHREFPRVKKIDISIKKLHPPINGFSGNVGVRFNKSF